MRDSDQGNLIHVQQKNKEWWETNPMSYAWKMPLQSEEGSPAFFAEVDQRFFSSSPFYRGDRPFARLIPYERLKGKDVLEIGCGLGSHAQLLAEAGCSLTAIDLTQKAVSLTKRPLSMKNIEAKVRLMNAEAMEFDEGSFDFVWSWRVFHHTANPRRAFEECYKVL